MDNKLIRNKLCNDFPSVYIKEIDNALKISKNSYIAAYYYLEDQLKNNSLKLKKQQGKQRRIDSILELDSIFTPLKI